VRIDKRLHLVVPIYGDEQVVKNDKGDAKMMGGKPVTVEPVIAYAHSTPLSVETVEKYFMVLAQTHAAIFNQGLGIAGGPPIAMMLLKKIATDDKILDGPDGVQAGLINEMKRLTSVIVPAPDGKGPWQQVPLGVAVDRHIISDEDRREVENAIAFFMSVSAVLNRAQRKDMLTASADLWGAQISLLNSTEFAASLATSTATANSGAKSHAPVIASAEPANAVVDGKHVSVPL
jgi:hypothetical protein